ncbi:TIGR03067 domain-containing protein [Solitalea koreensis]|nr:TIGR03067 domain-containing protein [Solitalea koreensis]
MKSIQGTWVPVEAELAGIGMLDEKLDSTILTIRDDCYAVSSGGMSDIGKISIGTERNPMTMNITGTEGANADKIIRAIFKFEQEDLIVCYNLNGGDRPLEFSTHQSTFQCLVRYRRAL